MNRLPHIHNILHQLEAHSVFVVSYVLVQFLLNNLWCCCANWVSIRSPRNVRFQNNPSIGKSIQREILY